MAKNLSVKNTKQEMLDAYDALVKELSTLQAQAKSAQQELDKTKQEYQKLQQQASKAPAASTAAVTTTQVVYQTAKVNDIQGIIAHLNNIQKGVPPALSEISAKMLNEAESLEELLESINEKKESLAKLYDIKVEDDILDKLIADYEGKEAASTEEQKKLKEAYQQEISEQRKSWEKEQAQQKKTIAERNEKADMEYQRNVKEYNYDLKLKRDAEKDGYEQKKKALQAVIAELQEKQYEEWESKEKAVKEQEEEFEKLKKEFEEIPAKLEKEIKKAEGEGKGIIEKDARVKAELAAKEVENAQRVYEMKISSLENTIRSQEAQLATINKQLETALKQAQDLAIKALEGSTNQKSFESIREIALEQAKNQPKKV